MPEHKKKVIPYAELLAKVQGILTYFPQGCRNIHIDSLEIYPRQVDGANWNIVEYRRSGDDNNLRECREKIAAELLLLRRSYDVDPGSRAR